MLRTWVVRLDGHRVHAVGQVLPGTAHALHVRLAAQLPFGADLARHAGDLGGEGVELVHHRVDRVLQLQDLAPDVHRDLLRQVAVRHRRRDLGDVTHLRRQVAAHRVHVVGEVLPHSRHTRHLRLTAQLAFGAHLARHAGHLRGERVELVHHRVDGVLELQDLPLHVHGDLLVELAAGHGRRHFGDVADLGRQVARHRVHVVGQVLPGPADAADLRLTTQLAFGAHLAGHAGHLGGEGVELVHHGVDGVLELEDLALHVHGDLLRQVAGRHRRRHVGDVAHLGRQVAGHRVHAVRQVLPGAADAGHLRLAAQLALRYPPRGPPGSLPRRRS